MEQMTRTLWSKINNYYIPLILDAVNDTEYTLDTLYQVVHGYHYEMKGFISGYLYMAPYGAETSENFKLAAEVDSEIWDEFWEIYTNR